DLRAPALPVHLLYQPGRVLRDPRRDGAPGPGLRPAAATRRHPAGDRARADPRAGRRTRGRAVPLLERGAVPCAGPGRGARARPGTLDPAPGAMAAPLLPRRDHAGAVAAGTGPVAPVPEDPQ